MKTSPTTTELFLVAAPGIEALVEAEALRLLPDAQCTPQQGGVQLIGDASLVPRANLLLRLPSRVLLRLGAFEARRFEQLRAGLAALPTSTYVPRGSNVAVRASASRCRLYHTGAIAEQVGLALGAEIMKSVPRDDDNDDAPYLILLRGFRDHFVVSLDTSGALLHKRGWRIAGGEAPLRETLAAAILACAKYDPTEPLCDPMCGSGTIAIEAALFARNIAPGIARTFAFQRFVDYNERTWQALCDEARSHERSAQPLVVAADADEAQLATARDNATRAGVTLALEHTSLESLAPRAPRGLVATNPPYGKRVGAADDDLDGLYRALRQTLRTSFAAWRVAVLLADRSRLAQLELTPALQMQNGGTKTWLGYAVTRRAAGSD